LQFTTKQKIDIQVNHLLLVSYVYFFIRLDTPFFRYSGYLIFIQFEILAWFNIQMYLIH